MLHHLPIPEQTHRIRHYSLPIHQKDVPETGLAQNGRAHLNLLQNQKETTSHHESHLWRYQGGNQVMAGQTVTCTQKRNFP